MAEPVIVVVEDEPDLASVVADRLRSAGFTVHIAANGTMALDLCATVDPVLVVLDLGLPGGMDGIEVCRRLQATRPVPVLMLTARSDETDVPIGLAVGADDYLTKPFSPREMVARVQAILRRSSTSSAPPSTRIVVRAVTVDVDTRQAWRDDEPAHLTATEFDLLRALLNAHGAVRTRAQLLSDVWGYRDGSGARTVDSHIRSLRRKLGDDLVRTVHGVGYAIPRVEAT